jgi:hypothetical protein
VKLLNDRYYRKKKNISLAFTNDCLIYITVLAFILNIDTLVS